MPTTAMLPAWFLSSQREQGRSPSLSVIAALFAGMFSTPSTAQVAVDQMSCSAALQLTQRAGAYSKRTGFGVVSIRPSHVANPRHPASCPPRFDLSFYIERTLDNPQCVLGYACIERVRLKF